MEKDAACSTRLTVLSRFHDLECYNFFSFLNLVSCEDILFTDFWKYYNNLLLALDFEILKKINEHCLNVLNDLTKNDNSQK